MSGYAGSDTTSGLGDAIWVKDGAYNSEKHANLREFVNSGELRENSVSLKYTEKIPVYQVLFVP